MLKSLFATLAIATLAVPVSAQDAGSPAGIADVQMRGTDNYEAEPGGIVWHGHGYNRETDTREFPYILRINGNTITLQPVGEAPDGDNLTVLIVTLDEDDSGMTLEEQIERSLSRPLERPGDEKICEACSRSEQPVIEVQNARVFGTYLNESEAGGDRDSSQMLDISVQRVWSYNCETGELSHTVLIGVSMKGDQTGGQSFQASEVMGSRTYWPRCR
jgi:hypothetical protein